MDLQSGPRPWWANIPNAISIARIATAPFLLAAALQNRTYFQWLLLACLVSDILDGWIARTFNLRSRMGAILDSTADILVNLITVVGLWVFQKDTIIAHSAIVLTILFLYLAEIAFAFLRYGRASSFHTVLIRIAAYAQGICILSLFFWGYAASIFYAAATLCILAVLEEIVIVCLFSEWTPDVGGLYWVLTKRRASHQ